MFVYLKLQAIVIIVIKYPIAIHFIERYNVDGHNHSKAEHLQISLYALLRMTDNILVQRQ